MSTQALQVKIKLLETRLSEAEAGYVNGIKNNITYVALKEIRSTIGEIKKELLELYDALNSANG